MIKYLFLDLDNTILDFSKAEAIAIRKTMREYGLEPTDALAARYSAINDLHWKALERGELTKPQVVTGRFAAFFSEQGIDVDAEAVAKTYETYLSQGHWFLPGAEETVKQKLYGKYKLYLASNGTAVVQQGRMTSAELYPYFQESFVSQELGHNKPSREYFDAAFARIPGFEPARCLMVGDSLTSDILGGKNAGLRTVWVNPGHKTAPEELKPDYEIEYLADLPALLEEIE
jgi:2-haloacid dehalogenase